MVGVSREERRIGESARKVVEGGLGLSRKVCLIGDVLSSMLISVCWAWWHTGAGKVG